MALERGSRQDAERQPSAHSRDKAALAVTTSTQSGTTTSRLRANLLGLQRSAGNRAVTAILRASTPPRENASGTEGSPLPDDLSQGVEELSGTSVKGVRAHFNSPEPLRIGAHAFTRGDHIYVGPGQERHLAHEAWHIVQQRQGRVNPTVVVDGQAVNDDVALERDAETMGARATSVARRLVRPDDEQPPATPKETTRGGSPVLQGQWVDENVMTVGKDPIDTLYTYARSKEPLVANFAEVIELLAELINEPGVNAEVRKKVLEMLAATVGPGQLWSTPQLLNRVSLTASDPDPLSTDIDDHGEDDRADAPEITITFDNFSEYIDTSQIPADDVGLYEVFAGLARSLGLAPTREIYRVWYGKGVLTRSGFRALFPSTEMDVSQYARTPNSLSYQDEYDTYNFGQFKKVTYRLDGDGNINYSKVKKASKWKNPEDAKTLVDLEKGAKKKGHGLMRSGKVVKIVDASRGQHFSIANRIMKYDFDGSPDDWTWHHMSKRFKMVLVDRRVHQKHGHNGGVYIW